MLKSGAIALLAACAPRPAPVTGAPSPLPPRPPPADAAPAPKASLATWIPTNATILVLDVEGDASLTAALRRVVAATPLAVSPREVSGVDEGLL
ncbi:MAG TPA: hypothetical protein VGM88_03765, partial [Kofleriaceae bacterium]